MNNNIINEFEKLLLLIRYKENKAIRVKDTKLATIYWFKYKSINNAIKIIKNLKKELTLDNLIELKEIKGIGKGILDRITEILKTGKLIELSKYKNINNKNENIIEELMTIIGIGRSKAIELINNGIKSVNDLIKKIKKKKLDIKLVNRNILLGLKYYNKCFGNIPRNEITKMYKIFEFIINKMNNNNNQYIFEICGSYRREKITSNDIDILISNKNNYSNINHLNYFVELLKQPIKLNNNQPLLIDDLTSKNYKTKYMGFIKYKDNLIRRLDIRYVSWDSYYTALLYFTGSAEFNQKIRKNAHELGYKLSEYNLIKIDTNTKININSENDIFNILNINYISPKFR